MTSENSNKLNYQTGIKSKDSDDLLDEREAFKVPVNLRDDACWFAGSLVVTVEAITIWRIRQVDREEKLEKKWLKQAEKRKLLLVIGRNSEMNWFQKYRTRAVCAHIKNLHGQLKFDSMNSQFQNILEQQLNQQKKAKNSKLVKSSYSVRKCECQSIWNPRRSKSSDLNFDFDEKIR